MSSAADFQSNVVQICQSVCEHYSKKGQHDKATKIYIALLEAPWIDEDDRRKILTKQKHMEASLLCDLGERCRAQGDLVQATQHLLRSCNLAEETRNLFCLQRVYSNLALMLLSIGQYQQAVRFFQNHLRVAVELGDNLSQKNAYKNLASACLLISDFSSGIEYAQEGLKVCRETGDIDGQLDAHFMLGQIYDSTGKIQESIAHHKKALEFAKSLGDKRKEGDIYGGLGNAYYSTADFVDSLAYQEKFLEIAQGLGDEEMMGRAFTGLGLVHHSRGDNTTAVPLHEKALEIANASGDQRGQTTCYGNLGNAAYAQSDYQKALDYYGKCLEIAKKLGNKEAVGMTYNSLGNTHYSMGDYRQALEYQQEALKVARETGARGHEAMALEGVGNVLYSLEEFDLAIEKYEEKLKISIEVGDKISEANAQGNLGNCYDGLGNYEKAVVHLKVQLRLSHEVGNKPGEARAYGNLGNAYYWLNDQEKAIEHHTEHLRIAQSINDKMSEGRSYGNLANAFRELKQHERAFEYYAKQTAVALSVNDRQGEADSYYNLSTLYEKLKEFGKAETEMRKCIKKYEEIRLLMRDEDAQKVSIGERHVRAYKKLTSILLKQGRPEDAFIACDRGRAMALKDLVRSRFNVGKNESEEPSGEIEEKKVRESLRALKQNPETTTLAFTFMSGGLSIWVIGKDGIQIKDASNGDQRFFERLLKTVTSALTNVEHDRGTGVCEGRDLAAQDEKEMEDFFATKPEKSPKAQAVTEAVEELTLDDPGSSPDKSEDVEQVLKSFPCSEESPLGNDDNAAQSARVPKSTTTRCVLPEEEEDEDENPLNELYNILIKPVEELIHGSQLLIIPEGLFYWIPFAALVDPQGRFLAERFSIQMCTSLETLPMYGGNTQEPHGGALVIGNPKIGRVNVRGQVTSPRPLPGAQVEAEAVAKCFNTSALLEEKATKAAVMKYLPEANVVHIAAHGDSRRGEIYLAPPRVLSGVESVTSPCVTPVESLQTELGILPSEDAFLLTCSDVARLHLRARLVVLSCCQTAGGTIKSAEGVVGIARSFLGAGAAAVLITLWAISDEATTFFMQSFYKFLLQGYSCCIAVQKSMNELRQTGQFSGAANWAPFFVIGQDVAFSEADVKQIKSYQLF